MTSKFKKISPQLCVTDMGRSIEFYTKKLGFVVDFTYQDFYAGISKDGCSIYLKVGENAREEVQNKEKNEDLDIVISVDLIEELFKELSDGSVRIIQELRDMDYGKEFYISDPDGHILGFVA